ncbi:dynactin subunit 4-like isoform X2 [Varroa jacobsoni]|nr:dynactin subunit 4-like isoform X2 [Varroa destructor]XP_022710542.1 dynactin subunit 4-like isoform X2 [Varroa jacobsoni]
MPSPEARIKKNVCTTCFECPCCGIALYSRGVTQQVPSEDDPNIMVNKRGYYLMCNSCKWSTHEQGLKNQPMASGGWPRLEAPNQDRVHQLCEYYRIVAHNEKLEKDKRRITQKCGYYISDKYGVATVVAKKYMSLQVTPRKESQKVAEGCFAAEASEEVDDLPERFLNNLNIDEVTNIRMRLSNPELQPTRMADLRMKNLKLLTKKSQRCKDCTHSLCKPEYNPGSVKFKIQLSAYYHIPEVRVKTCPQLLAGREVTIELTVTNPTPHEVSVALLPLEGHPGTPTGTGLIFPEVTCTNSAIALPSCTMYLSAKDDAAEYDDTADKMDDRNNKSVVTFKRCNKLGFKMQITPQQCSNVIIGFRLTHTYTNQTIQGNKREYEVLSLQHAVIVNLGPLSKE